VIDDGELPCNGDSAHDDVARALGSRARMDAEGVDASEWSRRSLAAARPLLAVHARRAYRRRVAFALIAALVPLPVIALYDRVLLGWLYGVAETVLPTPLAVLAVGGYAAATSLLLALTYAAIPVLVDRMQFGRFAR
jgi:hypothetical protein